MERSSRAILSPQEIASLRRLRADPRRSISSRHRQLLLSMCLIAVGSDDLKISDDGRNWRAMEAAEAGPANNKPRVSQ